MICVKPSSIQYYSIYHGPVADSCARRLSKTKRQDNHLFAPAGILNPLVIKSLPPFFPSLDSWVNRLLMFSLPPINFFLFLRSFSSSKTFAVSDAVAAFLIPVFVVGVDVPPRLLVVFPAPAASGSFVDSPLAFFLRFFEPGAFFRECVRPCSASF